MEKSDIKRSYVSPRWTGEFTDCSLPVTLDTYSNCSFGCVYCFSQYQKNIGKARKEAYRKKEVTCINVDKLKRIFSLEDKDSQFYDYVKDRRPIQYGGLADQFDGFERKYGVTLEVLRYLRSINYPICFSTKSTWVFEDERYLELFRGADNWNLKVSIITLDENDAKKIEVGVPSPQKRLEALKKWTQLNNGGATLRLRPFIIGVTDKTYLDLIRKAAEAGVTAVTTEFFCLERRAVNHAKEHYKTISECCGFDVVDFYVEHSHTGGYMRLNRTVKAKYIKKMRALCEELGLRFYVSDSHFKECSNNCCCCGLPESWNYSKGNFTHAMLLAKQNGSVHWSDVEQEMNFLERAPYRYAEGLNTSSCEIRAKFNGMSMKDYLHWLWNSPKIGQSPYKIFGGVLIPDGIDANKDIIYKYNDIVTI